MGTKDLAIFTRQFATMIAAGLPLVQCLDILAKQTSNPRFAKAIGEVTRDVEAGSTLADALGKHKNVFDDLFRNMVAAGEAGGILDEILARLATYIEKADALKRKVQGAMVYPAVVLSVCIGASVFMLIFIIPTFAKMFTDFGGDLPLPTKIVLGLSNILKSFWWVGVGAIVAAVVTIKRYYKTDPGQKHDRRPDAAHPGARRRAAQGLGGPLHAHPGHADLLRRADPVGARDHRPHRRQP